MVNTVTLNPAIDKVIFIDEFRRNVTNRIQNRIDTIGGKGTHVSVNLKLMGMHNRAFGVCHGEAGRRITEMLASHELDVRFIHRSEGDSRTNYIVVEDSGDTSLITEKGMPFTENDFRELLCLMRKEISAGDYLVFAGDASNAAPDIYCRIIKELEDKKPRVFLDTSGPALRECAALGPFLIKPNVDELSFLCGRNVTNDIDDIIGAVRSLSHFHISVIAVSMGKEGSLLCTEKGIYQALPPQIKARNTAGCGDSFLAGLLYGYANEFSVEETLKLATGAASAKAESQISAGFDPGKLKSYASETRVRKVQ
jgi:1-phosphofructokinase family hexose kinase